MASGKIENYIPAYTAPSSYLGTINYSYDYDSTKNVIVLNVNGTIESLNVNYSSYNTSSTNIVYISERDEEGAIIAEYAPTTAYNCQNLGKTQIFSYTVEIPYGLTSVYISWSFNGNLSTWNPNGTVAGLIDLSQVQAGTQLIMWVNVNGQWKQGRPYIAPLA